MGTKREQLLLPENASHEGWRREGRGRQPGAGWGARGKGDTEGSGEQDHGGGGGDRAIYRVAMVGGKRGAGREG